MDDGSELAPHMGLEGTPEDPWPAEARDQPCPGAWYRCHWYASVRRYKGPHGKAVTDRLVLDALEYIEDQEARAREHR